MNEKNSAFWLAAATALIWGSVPVMEKLGLGGTGTGLMPMAGVIVRTCGSFAAGLILFAVLSALRNPDIKVFEKPDIKAIAALSIAGIFGSVIGQIFFYYGLKNGNASIIAPVAGSFPLLTFIGGVVFLKEKVTPVKAAGAFVIITGLFLLNKQQIQADEGKMISSFGYALLTAAVWGLTPVLEKWALNGRNMNPAAGIIIRNIATGAAAILLFLFFAAAGRPEYKSLFSASAFAWVYLPLAGILGAVAGRLVFFNALKKGEAAVLTPVAGSYPMITFILGVLVLAEHVTFKQTIGVACVITGLWLIK